MIIIIVIVIFLTRPVKKFYKKKQKMNDGALIPFLLTLIAGGATAIGAGLTFVIRKNDFRVLALGMSFSAGVLI